jgi:N-acetylglucosaminyl-diphospho-decaprenol L-rhamnosyltransferase
MNRPASLDVVIVSYRCRELLRACLESLGEHPASHPTHVFVIDNASNDGTVHMVQSEFPHVRLRASRENLGFARANNLAIREGSAPYVLALNPDTRLTAGVLDRMLALMDERPEIGIAGCRLVLEDGTFDHAAKRSFPTPLSALAHFTGFGRRGGASARLAQYRAPALDEHASGPVDAVNGAFMLMRRAALEEVGLFDEGYWMYMEDLDLCYRFAKAGWLTWYEPSVTILHMKAGTSGKNRKPRLNYAFHYGMYRFYRKHYAPGRSLLVNSAVYAGIAGKLVLSLARSVVNRRVLSACAGVRVSAVAWLRDGGALPRAKSGGRPRGGRGGPL